MTCKEKWTLGFIEGAVGHLFSLTQEAVQGLGRRREECIFFPETWLLSTLFTPLSLPVQEKAGVWRVANSSLPIRPRSSSLSTDGEEVTFALFAYDPHI